jgi:hypothetical protein
MKQLTAVIIGLAVFCLTFNVLAGNKPNSFTGTWILDPEKSDPYAVSATSSTSSGMGGMGMGGMGMGGMGMGGMGGGMGMGGMGGGMGMGGMGGGMGMGGMGGGMGMGGMGGGMGRGGGGSTSTSTARPTGASGYNTGSMSGMGGGGMGMGGMGMGGMGGGGFGSGGFGGGGFGGGGFGGGGFGGMGGMGGMGRFGGGMGSSITSEVPGSQKGTSAPMVIEQSETEMRIINTINGKQYIDTYKLDGKTVSEMVELQPGEGGSAGYGQPSQVIGVKIPRTTQAKLNKSKGSLDVKEVSTASNGKRTVKTALSLSKDGKVLTLKISTSISSTAGSGMGGYGGMGNASTSITSQTQKLIFNRQESNP